MALTMLIAFGLLSQRAYADDWVMAFHDSRHTGQTSEVVTPPMSVAWTWTDTEPYDIGNGGKFIPQKRFWLPVYYRGKLCFQGGNNANRIFCLNPANGVKIWEYSNPGYAQAGTYLFQFDNYPSAVNGRIVNASTDYTASVDAATGLNSHLTFNTNGGWPSGGTASWNNMAYIQYVRTDDNTEGFNIVQDPTAWALSGGYWKPDFITTYTDYSFRVPAVDNDIVYVNILGRLNALDAITGRGIWAWDSLDFDASPAVSNGIVYFYSASLGQMTALNAAQAAFSTSGTQVPTLWAVPMDSAYSPIVSDGTVYVGCADGYFYALDAATGAQKWSFWTSTGFGALQIPAISGDLIYVPGADGILYALQKKTGVEVWRRTGTAAWGPVVVGGGMVFASDLTNTLYAFRPQTAAIGPAVTALSTSRAANNAAAFVNLTGSGFFAGGAASAVQSVYLDNSVATLLSGYTVASDQSITGVVIPAGIAAGVYHIKVQTSVGTTVNEPTFRVEAATSSFISSLGQSTGPIAFGTNLPFQRHLARTSNGTLAAVYIGTAVTGGAQYPTYNFSHDGGLTWSAQGQVFLSNNGTVVGAPSTSIWMDPQDQINISSTQWPSYSQTFQKFAMNAAGVLSLDPGFPNHPSGGGGSTYPGTLVGEPGGRLWLALESGGVVTAYYSDNGGLNWIVTPQINRAAGTSPVMVLYQGKPAVIYSDGGSLAWSAWSGQAWSSPQTLPGPITGVQQSMSAVVNSNGQVHLVYSTSSGGVFYVSYSAPTWSLPVALDVTGTSPSLTTDGSNLWCFYGNAAGNLVYRRASSGQWNSAVAVTSDGNHNTAPTTLTLSPDGQIPVLWTSGTSTGYHVNAALVPGASLSGLSVPAVSVAPSSAALSVSQTQQFTATVTNTSNTAVSWTLSPSLGSLTSSGLYTAPASIAAQQTVTITATSLAGTGITASAVVTLLPTVSVTVGPATATVSAGGSQQFTATVANTSNTAVTWTLSPSLGTITSTGLYTAAASVPSQQTVTITAASVADTTKTAAATVTLVSNVAVTVVPGSASLGQSGTFQFTAQVSNTANTGVTWTLNPNVGTISGTGLYTAPASVTAPQAVVVTATSASDPSKAGTAAITLVPPPALSISQTHSGAFTQGQTGSTYNVTVSNGAGAGPTNGTVTLTETLPTGLTLVSMAGTGWSCTGATCTRGDALSAGASYPAVTVTVNVAANAGTPLAAQVSMSGGGSPAATASDTVVVTPASGLSIAETHTGNFSQGQAIAVYTITVSNQAAAGPTTGLVSVTEAAPAGITLVSMSGTGWTCGGIACTRSDVLNPGGSYPPITVTVNVDPAAPAQVTNTTTVSGGGSLTPSLSASDVTGINPITDVSGLVTVTETGFGVNHATRLWTATITIANTSGTAIKGPIQVVLTNLSPNATMVNNTGARNGSPYLTVSAGGLAAGASVAALIQFTNPTSGFINCTPQIVSGIF